MPSRLFLESFSLLYLSLSPLCFGNEARSPADALKGQVTSIEEGPMEGVLVSARKAGSIVSLTVVSDQHGYYKFPRDRMTPGKYDITIRAARYTMQPKEAKIVSGHTTRLDLALVRLKDYSSQLMNIEWEESIGALGTKEQKKLLQQSCHSCHTLERVLRSTYTYDQWKPVLLRMHYYSPQGAGPDAAWGYPFPIPVNVNIEQREKLARFLSTINLSSDRKTWSFPLKTMPRPTGKATHVLVTTYHLPRPHSLIHDTTVDNQGIVWYVDWTEPILGMLDPKIPRIEEYRVPPVKPARFNPGLHSMQMDDEGNPWFARPQSAAIAMFDKRSKQFRQWLPPKPYDRDSAVVFQVVPGHRTVDQKVWFNNCTSAIQGYMMSEDKQPLIRHIHRLDFRTDKIETIDPFAGLVGKHSIYGLVGDSQNNAWFADMAGGNIGRIDAKTLAVELYPIPTPNAGPRRMHVDSEDRVWFGEYFVRQIGVFDYKTKKFREWKVPVNAYDVVLDKQGFAWTGSMDSDYIVRVNTQTGENTVYLLPGSGMNTRRVEIDNSPTPPVLWVGDNHSPTIYKIEPMPDEDPPTAGRSAADREKHAQAHAGRP